MEKLKMNHHLSEFEMRRLKNIEDNKRVLALLNQDLENYGIKMSGKELYDETKKPGVVKKAPVRRRERTTMSALFLAQFSPPRTRSRKNTSDQNENNGTGMVVKLDFGRKRKRSEGSDEENAPKRRYSTVVEDRWADEITDQDLELVANCFGDKVYDSYAGSSCHQCRQKTLDQKTICRSGHCLGVRGQFCGPCLKIRYGEDAREALKNPNWTCPPCRGICNCSFCRKKSGRSCTGILIHVARQKGFDDVNSYLQSLQQKLDLSIVKSEPLEHDSDSNDEVEDSTEDTEESTKFCDESKAVEKTDDGTEETVDISIVKTEPLDSVSDVDSDTEEASDNATGQLTEDGTGQLTDDGTGKMTDDGTGNLTDDGTGQLTEDGTGQLTEDGTGQLTDDGTGQLTEDGTGQLTADGTGQLTEDGTGNLTEDGTGQLTDLSIVKTETSEYHTDTENRRE